MVLLEASRKLVDATKPSKHTKDNMDVLTVSETIRNYLLGTVPIVVTLAMSQNYVDNGTPFRFPTFLYRKYLAGELYVLPSFAVLFLYQGQTLLCMLIEKALLRRKISERSGLCLYAAIVVTLLSTPVAWFRFFPGITACIRAVLVTIGCYEVLKMISYYQVNKEHRMLLFKQDGHDVEQKHVETRSVKYPENLTALNAIRFSWIPSYCYYVNIEWDTSFRTFELLIALAKMFAGLEVMLNIIDHIIYPNMADLYPDVGIFRYDSRGHFLDTVVHVTLLAWPVAAMALLGCYTFLYKSLDIAGLLTRYPDRKFYGEWWNVTEAKDYWSTWNLPVHKWMLRHLYAPCKASGIPPWLSAMITFFVSGLLHDYVIMTVMDINTYFLFTLGFVGALSNLISCSITRSVFGGRVSSLFHCLIMWPAGVSTAIIYQYKKNVKPDYGCVL